MVPSVLDAAGVVDDGFAKTCHEKSEVINVSVLLEAGGWREKPKTKEKFVSGEEEIMLFRDKDVIEFKVGS